MTRARTSPPGAPPPGGGSSDAIEAAIRRHFAPETARADDRPLLRRLRLRWRRMLRRLRALGELTHGNRIEVLADGDEAFERMWEAISGARRRVCLDTYILADDRVGHRTLSLLADAARRGCEVALVYDAVGSIELGAGATGELRAAGGHVVVFNAPWSLRPPLSRFVRDHHKLLVVDGEVAFCGGRNVGEQYAGTRHGEGFFRDLQLRLQGPCARSLERVATGLLATEAAERGANEAASADRGAPPHADGSLVQVLESNVPRERRAIQRALRITLSHAVARCYVSSPYFVPPVRLLRALERAASRGVDVRVLTAGRSDVPLVSLASRHLYARLLRAGVRLYEMQEPVLHAKAITVDGVYASVGSFNLDPWSWYRNLEVTVTTLDRGVTGELDALFRRDAGAAREVAADAWGRRGLLARLASWLAYQILRF